MKKMPFAEADFLVRVLTRDFGKMDVLAKGARKSASKLNAHLDMLNHIRLQFVKPASPSASLGGNGERIPTLTDAEIISRFDDWFSDAEKLSIIGRVLQVIDMIIMPGAKDEKLFSMCLDFFRPKADQPEAGGIKSLENEAVNFLHEFFAHEGYGDSLPPEYREAIIQKWPDLRN